MAGIIRNIKDYLGNVIYPKTKEQAVYDNSNRRLDQKIGDIDTLNTTEKTNLVGAINELDSNIGDLSDLDTTSNTDLVGAINENTSRIKDVSVNIKDFGATTTNADNHDAIIAALDYLDDNNGGTLLVHGLFNTSPLILNGYKNIIIKGNSPSLPWKTPSGFKIISAGEVGLQLCEQSGLGYTNEVPTWNSINIRLEDLYIDGNHLVNFCTNGNQNIYHKGVVTEHAILDGVIFEPMTYPFTVENSFSRYCGRHGYHVKAPFTTIYTFINSESFGNDGYGIVIEDGNTCSIDGLLCQQNKQGGIKIEQLNPSLFTHPIFLGNIIFKNLYTEQNGLLLDADPNYEGNCAFKTLSYNTTALNNIGKISGITFINCKIQKSIESGFTSKAWELKGLGSGIIDIGTAIPDSAYDFTTCGTLNRYDDYTVLETLLALNNPVPKSVPYNNGTTGVKAYVGHGFIGKRGRMREFHFYKAQSDITAGTLTLMKSVYPINANYANYYPVLQAGSVYGINIIQSVKPSAGTLTFKVRYGFKSSGAIGSSYLALPTMQLDNTKNFISLTFPLLQYAVAETLAIGIEITPSADYVAGSTTSDIICELFIES